MIKAIIFDGGGVILNDRAENVYKKLSEKLKINTEEFLQIQQQYKESLLRGKTSSQEFAHIIKNKFKIRENILDCWKESYMNIMSVNKQLVKLVKKLRKDYITAIISNTPYIHAQINKKRGVYTIFDYVIISCEVGLIKPEEKIFKLMLKRLKTLPSESIFIDDRKEHLEVPGYIGFKTILFKSNQQLRESLQNEGVEI